MRFTKDGIPVLKGFLTETHLRVWCPYCRAFHYHGKGEGHRAAHCVKDNPLRQTGYYVAVYTKAELKGVKW